MKFRGIAIEDRRAVKKAIHSNFSTVCEKYAENRTGTPADTIAEIVNAIGYDSAVVTIAEIVNTVGTWDGRISADSRAWAESIENAADADSLRDAGIYQPDEIHPAHINQLAEAMAEYTPAEAEEIPEEVKKLEALKAHLIDSENFTEEEVEELEHDSRFDCFTCGSWEYKVFTEDEADEAVKAEILDTLWAFNPDFILRHTAFYQQSTEAEDEEFCKSLRDLQGRICEGANAIVKALIEDIDRFISDAVDADGRGHFLATYDGEELEIGDFCAYRIN